LKTFRKSWATLGTNSVRRHCLITRVFNWRSYVVVTASKKQSVQRKCKLRLSRREKSYIASVTCLPYI
jgi:hypothetical protein